MDWLIGVRMVWKRATSAAVVEPDGLNAYWSMKSRPGGESCSAG